jgi:hypothetical protein
VKSVQACSKMPKLPAPMFVETMFIGSQPDEGGDRFLGWCSEARALPSNSTQNRSMSAMAIFQQLTRWEGRSLARF